jgi:hypothetical protein
MEARKAQHGIAIQGTQIIPGFTRWAATARAASGAVVVGEGWTEAAAVHACVQLIAGKPLTELHGDTDADH